VIALHGRNGNAAGVMDMGVHDGLAQAVKVGWPPFAVVSVDGGANDYWHRRASGSDAGAMVINELLPLLASEESILPESVSSAGRWVVTAHCGWEPFSDRHAPRGYAR
jgi:hypothetical protein